MIRKHSHNVFQPRSWRPGQVLLERNTAMRLSGRGWTDIASWSWLLRLMNVEWVDHHGLADAVAGESCSFIDRGNRLKSVLD